MYANVNLPNLHGESCPSPFHGGQMLCRIHMLTPGGVDPRHAQAKIMHEMWRTPGVAFSGFLLYWFSRFSIQNLSSVMHCWKPKVFIQPHSRNSETQHWMISTDVPTRSCHPWPHKVMGKSCRTFAWDLWKMTPSPITWRWTLDSGGVDLITIEPWDRTLEPFFFLGKSSPFTA